MGKRVEARLFELDFSDWYRAYPVHKARDKAKIAYVLQRSKGVTAQEILDGTRKYCDEIRVKKIAPEFVKHPATWLRGACWMDEQPKELTASRPRTSFRESDLARQMAEYEAQPRPKLRSAADILAEVRAAKRTD